MTAPRLLALGSATLLVVAVLGAPAFADVFNGDDDPNTIVATNGNDTIRGYAGADVITARKGNDTVKAGAGDDRVDAGQGADQVWGGGGNDVLDIGTADDREDRAYGQAGDDTVYLRFTDDAWGGRGNDRFEAVYAARGMQIDCGAGVDRVIFNQPSPQVQLVGCEKVTVISAG
jgi:Ca2+-binding RTX toxin-like protein